MRSFIRNFSLFRKCSPVFLFFILVFNTISSSAWSIAEPQVRCHDGDAICDARGGENPLNSPKDCNSGSNPNLINTKPKKGVCDSETVCSGGVSDGCCPAPESLFSPNPKCPGALDIDCATLDVWKCPYCGDGSIVNPPENCDPNSAGPGKGCDIGVDPNQICTNQCTCIISACGNKMVEPGEECDPPNGVSCNDKCKKMFCGDLITTPAAGEECDPPDGVNCGAMCKKLSCGDGIVTLPRGEECDPPNGSTCGDDCKKLFCGDGKITGTEKCDPKALVIGCGRGEECNDMTCQCQSLCGNLKLDLGEDCDPPDGKDCSTNCKRLTCGDGIITGGRGEECEPPGSNCKKGINNGTCDASCKCNVEPICGNSKLEMGEECDPPDVMNCSAGCKILKCGDGIVTPPRREECDPPDGVNCGTDCKKLKCGDGIVTSPREECDPLAAPAGCPAGKECVDLSCLCRPICGNGNLDPGEDCDPPNGMNCGINCKKLSCGDGIVSGGLGEECDPPDGSSCGTNCKLLKCGDGITTGGLGEECDPPDGSSCGNDCKRLFCGDGKTTGTEKCDPNQSPTGCGVGDTCNSRTCECDAPVPDFCGDGKITGTEICDPKSIPPGCSMSQVCNDQTCKCDNIILNFCGDGTISGGERCDPAATPNGCGQNESCNINSCQCDVFPVCGNSVQEGSEECDPPNGVTCDNNCKVITPGQNPNPTPNPNPNPDPQVTQPVLCTAQGAGGCGENLSSFTPNPCLASMIDPTLLQITHSFTLMQWMTALLGPGVLFGILRIRRSKR